jgi:superkiller protein 3
MRLAVARGVADPPLLRQLGLSLAEVGKPGEAIPLLEPLVASEDPDVLNAMGMVLSEAGRQEEARRTLERVFARDPRNPVAHQHLALVALRRQDWTEAERQAEACLALNPGLGLAWNYLGTARYNLGHPQEALAAWERSVETDPRGYDALYNLAVVALEVRDLGRARRALARFVETAPPARYAPDIEKARGWLRELG